MEKSCTTNKVKKCDSSGSNVAIAEQLLRLQPTKELVTYYRNRVIAFEKDYEGLLDIVEQCKHLCDRSFQLEQELQQCVAESLELRKIVSDLQAYIFQERSEVLRLYAENDDLKIREADARKKIELLLTVHEEYNHRSIPLILSESCQPKLVRKKYKDIKKNVIKQQKDATEKKLKDMITEHASNEVLDPEILKMKVLALSSQLEERTSLFQDQVETLLKDRELTQREHERDLDTLHCKITSLTMSLKDAQDKVCEMAHCLVEEKDDRRKTETQLIAEQDRIFHAKEASLKCSELSSRLQENGKAFSANSKVVKALQQDLKILRDQLKEQDKVTTAYREHCHLVEDELRRVREQLKTCEQSYKEKLKKVTDQVSFWKEKCNRLDCHRKLQCAGFCADIKMMRARLKALEDQTQK